MTGNREDAIARSTQYLDTGEFEAELARRVAIRTESQIADNTKPLDEYIHHEMVPAFEQMEFNCTVFENPVPGHGPILLAERHESDKYNTVLGYGHGDVIIGQDNVWQKGNGPWKLARDGEKLYGRGTADNKAQHTINMAALRCVLEEKNQLGFNAKMLIEMGEEAGSVGLREVITSNKDKCIADVFIGSDGPRVNPHTPTLTLGSRGAINFELTVNLRQGAHHSGNWGGLIADPAIILTSALATITDSKGQIQINEWLAPRSDVVIEALRGVEVSAGDTAPEIDLHWGDPNLTPAEKVYSANSFAILAIICGDPDNPVNAIAPTARAHCQLRYFAGTNDALIIPALRKHLDERGFEQVLIDDKPEQNGASFPAARTEPDNPWVEFVAKSMKRTNRAVPTILPSMGGSICNDLFTDLLGLPAIWIPHSYAGCSQHAPDEHVLLPLCRSALETMTGLYWDLGTLVPA